MSLRKRLRVPHPAEPVRLVREADGAYCEDCGWYGDELSHAHLPRAWTWRKSQWMHERGTGHRTRMFRYVSAQGGQP
jgi:hypothetical protein